MDQKQKSWLMLGIAALLVAIAFWQFWPLDKQIRKGLDIQGGLSVILTAREANVSPLDLDRAERIIQERVNGLGVSEASVQRQGSRSLLVQLPGIKDPGSALRALKQTGKLEFVDVASIQDSSTVTEIEQWSQLSREAQARQKAPSLKQGTYTPVFTGAVITDAGVEVDENGNPAVVVKFNSQGREKWADYTTANVGKKVAIVLDQRVVSAPNIQEPITNGDTRITGSFSPAEARRLSTILQSGALPVALDFSQSQVVGPTLGEASLTAGLLAALIGLGAVAVYMVAYYRGLGIVSWFSLAIFSAIFLGVLAVLSKAGAFALSLPGIAGIVLTIGLAADSSILMLERFKEEVAAGKSMRTAARDGTWHAFGTSVDADIVTFVTAAVIFGLAIGPVRGFALTLIIGIVTDLTVAYLFTRNAMILLSDSVVAKAPWFFNVKGGGTGA